MAVKYQIWEIQNAYKILVGNPKPKRLLDRPRHGWGIIINLKKWDVMVWGRWI